MSAHATTMHAYSPASYSLAMILALMIHGAIAAVLVLSAYFFNDIKQKTNDIFVVVAGPGDNWKAVVAPAQGTPDAPANVTFTPPADTPHPAPIPEAQPEPEPTPVAPATSVPQTALVVSPTKTIPKKTPTKTDPKQTQKQSATHTITKADFDKQNAKHNQNPPSSRPPSKTSSSTSPGKAVTAQQITSPGKGLVDGVPGGSGSEQGAGGCALTVTERDQLDAYFALLAERIKQAHEKPEGVSMELVTRVEYQVAANGTIGAVKIIKSSGNRAFDDSVLKAFRSVRPIGPRPDGRSGSKIADFRMKEE